MDEEGLDFYFCHLPGCETVENQAEAKMASGGEKTNKTRDELRREASIRENLCNVDRPFRSPERAEVVFGAWGKTLDQIADIPGPDFEA